MVLARKRVLYLLVNEVTWFTPVTVRKALPDINDVTFLHSGVTNDISTSVLHHVIAFDTPAKDWSAWVWSAKHTAELHTRQTSIKAERRLVYWLCSLSSASHGAELEYLSHAVQEGNTNCCVKPSFESCINWYWIFHFSTRMPAIFIPAALSIELCPLPCQHQTCS